MAEHDTQRLAHADDEHDGGGEPGEDEKERLDRELIELLNELRVALPGVQVLFAFLLTVPFAQGFQRTTAFQRDLFFATLMATAASTVLLIAPSAIHRILFRQHEKRHMLMLANRLTIAGLAILALAMTLAVVLIADVLFGESKVILFSTLTAAAFAFFWFAIPVWRRLRHTPDD